ncbi:hypothetical protein WJX72_000052 [[Myrmecia] bisecta]|uniref:Transmembrane protein 231 n=1 Tax=[Myrmecia] bisecta TaxID=41462 RepID=A0AAW1PJF3_9CHLO
MVQIYAEPFCRRHYGRRFSKAFALRGLLQATSIVLACVIAYATGNLWQKTAIHLEQPKVAFTYDVLLVLEGTQTSQIKVWSTYPELNTALGSKLASVDVQATQQDTNFDDITDIITVTLTSASSTPIHSAKMLMQFNYRLEDIVTLQMQSLAFVSHTSPLPGSSLTTDGQLRLRQGFPLWEGGNLTDPRPALLSSIRAGGAFQATETLKLSSILSTYLDRNQTTAYVYDSPVWEAGDLGVFTIDCKIRIPKNELVIYRPQRASIVKQGWIQILSIYIILWWVFSWCEVFVFRYRILDTRTISDVDAKAHRF